jgi:micrococcal nuclease
MKRLFLSVVGVAALVATTAAFAAPSATARARLVRVTSPISPGSDATLVAQVRPARRCRITVYYKSGPSVAQGLYPKRPHNGRVSWTWMVGTNTTPGRWPIQVSCGSAGSFRTSFKVAY